MKLPLLLPTKVLLTLREYKALQKSNGLLRALIEVFKEEGTIGGDFEVDVQELGSS